MNETALPQVPVFTDEEFIAWLGANDFWTEGLIADTDED
jgi:hypothetical protein